MSKLERVIYGISYYFLNNYSLYNHSFKIKELIENTYSSLNGAYPSNILNNWTEITPNIPKSDVSLFLFYEVSFTHIHNNTLFLFSQFFILTWC